MYLQVWLLVVVTIWWSQQWVASWSHPWNFESAQFHDISMWQRGQVLTWNFKAASVSGGFPGFPGPKHPVSTPERAVAAAPREGKAKAKAATPAPQTPQPQAAPAAAPAPVEEPIVTPKEEVVGETLKTMHLGFEDMKSCFENEKINDSKYTFSFFWQVFSIIHTVSFWQSSSSHWGKVTWRSWSARSNCSSGSLSNVATSRHLKNPVGAEDQRLALNEEQVSTVSTPFLEIRNPMEPR